MQQDKKIPTIDLRVPASWEELTDNQLRYLFGLIAQDFPSPQVKTYCFFRWTGMQVMHRYGKGWWCKFADDELRKRESGGASANSNKFGLRSACTELPVQSLRDIVDLMRNNEAAFPHFRTSATYKLFEPPVFENKKQKIGYCF